MCGIFGVTNFQHATLSHARESLNTLSHRGPDQWDDYFDENIYLGHRRLSILDLSEAGKQPMACEDQNIFISVNGEIYNFQDLRNKLKGKYNFQSTSDSEVILHGYKEWGIDQLLEKIDGMYAFSIYDKKSGVLYLVRDRVGIKPLYYSNYKKQIAFASELKAIQYYYGEENLEIDNTALYDFLTYKYIPSPKTMYNYVYKLKPGHYLKVNLRDQSIHEKKYWSLQYETCNDDIADACSKIRSLVKKSVEEQMMSDVPVGFFLSGGLDSSTVVAMASDFKSEINTFSIGFSDKDHDETHYADVVAQKFKTNHHKKILDESKTKELISNIKTWYDEPYADFSCFPTFLVSKYARENVTVVLTGDGGDEVFGGYNWYNQFVKKSRFRFGSMNWFRSLFNPFRNKYTIIDKIINRLENPYLLTDLEHYTKLMSGYIRSDKEEYRKAWNIPEDYDDYWFFRKYYRKDLEPYTRLQYLDFHTYLPEDILTKVDRVSMAVSLECRVPLLSKELIEYLFSLSPEVRLYNDQLKGAMKEAFKEILPDQILNREKKGFSIPIRSWREDVLKDQKSAKELVLNHIFEIKV